MKRCPKNREENLTSRFDIILKSICSVNFWGGGHLAVCWNPRHSEVWKPKRLSASSLEGNTRPENAQTFCAKCPATTQDSFRNMSRTCLERVKNFSSHIQDIFWKCPEIFGNESGFFRICLQNISGKRLENLRKFSGYVLEYGQKCSGNVLEQIRILCWTCPECFSNMFRKFPSEPRRSP